MSERRRAAVRRRLAVVLVCALAASAAVAAPADAGNRDRHHGARHADQVIVLPGATSAEGIAAGRGSTFYAGDLVAGDIFRGDVRTGTAELFIDAPEGRMAVGMAVDRRGRLLYVAGGLTGQGYVYDLQRATTVATYQFAPAGAGFVNDVVVTERGAWFTNSSSPELYLVPFDRRGRPTGDVTTLPLTGPAAEPVEPGAIGLNGIVAAKGGRRLIVAHSTHERLYLVDPRTGGTEAIAGLELPNVDGLVLQGRRLWAVQNFINQVAEVQLSGDLRRGRVRDVITSDLFQIPTTAALVAGRLAVVNAKFDTGFPPSAEQYEVVVLRR
jgi:hypothetical protein